MTDAPIRLEFTNPVSDALMAQIAAPAKADRLAFLRPWYRRIVFFLAFIVAPGLLGGLHLASDRFNVGLMIGGLLAMVLDGYLMDHKPGSRAVRPPRRYDHLPRSIGPEGLTVVHRDHEVRFGWRAVKKVDRFADGIALHLRFNALFPIDFADLPPGTSPDELAGSIALWHEKPARKSAK